MAFSFKYTRYTAIAQICLGVLSLIFGIADRATIFRGYAGHSQAVAPVWMGVWFIVTGVIGYYASNRSYSNDGRPSRALIGTYNGFSIASVIFAAVLIIMYSIGVSHITNGSPCRYRKSYQYHYDGHKYSFTWKSLEKECHISTAMAAMIIIFAILEFGFGLGASICCCANGCCECCNPTGQQATQMGQVVFVQTQGGQVAHIITQGANGVPVAVPAAIAPVASAPPVQGTYNPSIPAYPVATVGGAQALGAQGGGTQDAQAPPLETKRADMPPAYYQA